LNRARHEKCHSVGNIGYFLFPDIEAFKKKRQEKKSVHGKLVCGAIHKTTKKVRQHLSPLSRVSWLKHSSGSNSPVPC